MHAQSAGKRRAQRALLASQSAAVAASFYLSYLALPLYRPYLRGGSAALGPFVTYAWLLLAVSPLWYALERHAGLHTLERLRASMLVARTLRVEALGLAALSAMIFAFKAQAVSRLLVFGFCLLHLPVSMLFRAGLEVWLAARGAHIYNITRVLVIGSRQRAREFIAGAHAEKHGGFCIVGCLDPEAAAAPAEVAGVPVLGSTELLREYLFAHPVDLVVFAMPADRVPNARELIGAALELGLRVAVLPDFYLERMGISLRRPEVQIEFLSGRPVAELSGVPRNTSYLAVKRAMDVAVSAALLLVLAPLFAAIALLVKLTSTDGPVFFPWRVLGVNKKPFTSYKFRTMVPNAEQLKPNFLDRNEMSGPAFKLRRDPRVTPLGRLLRRYSLDELPQLWSVLKGEMSLVGPRPPFPEEAAQFEFWQRRKLSIKPGITCLWQVNGRSEIRSFEKWARLDLQYVDSASLWLDCKILLKTIPAVLRGRGAY